MTQSKLGSGLNIRLSVVFIVATMAFVVSAIPARAAFYPEHGDLVYNGGLYANSYFTFTNPGPWSDGLAGYEHDFVTSPTYFDGCTTWTNLYDWYDDCPTAGVSESGTQWAFSFGTYTAIGITPGQQYRGDWYFKRTASTATSSSFSLDGQEVNRRFCPFKSIWCMGAIQTRILTQGTLVYNGYLVKSW